MHHRVVFGLGLLACIWGAGCKSADESIPKDQLASRYAALMCDSLGACCQASHFTFDSTNCRGTEAAKVQENIDSLTALGVAYDGDAAGECLAALKDTVHCERRSTDAPPACGNIFVGALQVGAACSKDVQCKRPGRCLQDADGKGMCDDSFITATHGREGDACKGTCFSEEDCRLGSQDTPTEQVACYVTDGLHCMDTCRRLGAVGETCDASNTSCEPGLFCAVDGTIAGSGSGRCTAPHPLGAACQASQECQSLNCDGGKCGDFVTAEQCASGRLD